MSKKVHSELRGTKVIGAHGRILGEIDDVDIDPATWRAVGIVIRVNSDAVVDLGLEKPFWSKARLTIPVHHIAATTDVLLLQASLQELAEYVAAASAETD